MRSAGMFSGADVAAGRPCHPEAAQGPDSNTSPRRPYDRSRPRAAPQSLARSRTLSVYGMDGRVTLFLVFTVLSRGRGLSEARC